MLLDKSVKNLASLTEWFARIFSLEEHRIPPYKQG